MRNAPPPPPIHPLAWRVLKRLAMLGTDGGTDPGGPLHDIYNLRRADGDRAVGGGDPDLLDALVTRWCDAGCPTDALDPGSSRREDILERIRSQPGRHTVRTLAAATGLGERMVRMHLGRLQADGLLIGVEPGNTSVHRYDLLTAIPLEKPRRARITRSTTP